MKQNLFKTWGLALICISTILLGACAKQDNPAYLKIKNIFHQAQMAQDEAYADTAMDLYKECVNLCASDQNLEDDSIALLLPKALVQIVNIYQSQSKTKECIAYFDSLKKEVDHPIYKRHNATLTQNFKRDVYILLSYSLSRTDAEVKAAELMDTALTLPIAYPTPERKLRQFAYAAAVYYCVPADQNKVLKYGRMALDELQECENKSGSQWLIAIMAKLYQGNGDIGKAIAMCREGYELAETSQDTLGMANSKKELADYLYQWKLYNEADNYISDAIRLMEQTNNSNPMVATVAYTIKAKIMVQKGNIKEALAYLHQAKEISKDLPYNSGASDVDLLMGKILVNSNAKTQDDKYKQGTELLKKVAQEATYKLRAQAYLDLAKAYLQHGDEKEGETALDSMYAVMNSTPQPLMIEDAYKFAQIHYLSTGNTAQIVRYAAALNRQSSIEEKAHAVKNAAKSLAQFEMEKQEQEMKQKMKEIEMRKAMEIVAIILGIIGFLAVLAYTIWKRRKMQKKHILTEQELSKVQQELSKTSEEKSKVEEEKNKVEEEKNKVEEEKAKAEEEKNKAQEEKTKMAEELKKMESQDLDKMKAGISIQQILDLRGDEKFKDYFIQAFPEFISLLRQKAPNLTTKEELYCMLMGLNTTNSELSQLFHIARSSVIVAKYRIRKKLNLEDGVSMEDYLADLCKKEASLSAK